MFIRTSATLCVSRARSRALGGVASSWLRRAAFAGASATSCSVTDAATDYIEVSLASGCRDNLSHDDLEADAFAYGIATLMTNLFGRGKEPFWQDASTNLVKCVILLHKTLDDYVTLFQVYEHVINPDKLRARITKGERRLTSKNRLIAIDKRTIPRATPDDILGTPPPPLANLLEQGKVVALNLPVAMIPGWPRALDTMVKQDCSAGGPQPNPRMGADLFALVALGHLRPRRIPGLRDDRGKRNLLATRSSFRWPVGRNAPRSSRRKASVPCDPRCRASCGAPCCRAWGPKHFSRCRMRRRWPQTYAAGRTWIIVTNNPFINVLNSVRLRTAYMTHARIDPRSFWSTPTQSHGESVENLPHLPTLDARDGYQELLAARSVTRHFLSRVLPRW